MSRGNLALITVLFLVACRIVDLWVTLHFNPSLDREGNPIIRNFGGGAPALIGMSVIVVIALSGGLFVFCRGQPLSTVAIKAASSFRRFVFAWLKEVVGRRDLFAEWMPGGSRWTHSVQAIRLVSVAASWAIIFGSVTGVCAWFGLENGFIPHARELYSSISIGGTSAVPYLMASLGFVGGAVLFFIAEYSAMRRTAGI